MERLTIYLWRQSWQIVLLFIVVLLVCLAFKRASAHWKYLLWLVVLAKCLLPPFFTLPIAVLPAEGPEITATAPIERVESVMADSVVIDTSQRLEQRTTVPIIETGTFDKVPGAKQSLTLGTRSWLGIGWCAGVVLVMLFCIIRALRINRWLILKRHKPAEGLEREINALFKILKLRRPPEIWLAHGIGQPFVWGVFRGAIYLPQSFGQTGGPEHREGVLMHELAHVVRNDAIINLLQIMTQSLFFFHPLVWLLNRTIRREREKCCDEMSIAMLNAEPEQYSRAIVDSLIHDRAQTRPLPTMAVAGPLKNIEDRIKTIMQSNRKFHKRPTLKGLAVVLLIAALTLPASLMLTARAEKSVTNEESRLEKGTNDATTVPEEKALTEDENNIALSPRPWQVVPKEGIGQLKFGMIKDEVVKIMGEPEQKTDKDQSFIYGSMGFSLGFSRQGYLYSFNCYTKKAVWPLLLIVNDFPGQTDKGIKFGSNENEIITVYGPADKRDVNGKQVTLTYQDQGFYFYILKDKLVQFGMHINGRELQDKINERNQLTHETGHDTQ